MAEVKNKKKVTETPLMKQYNEIKGKHPDALLLFRVGDFYETFGSDAVRASQILGIVLTKRANGSASEVELAGFPHHSLDTYLPKLVRAGLRVAICDQLEDPKATKTIVKRGVTELVTPGVTMNDEVLHHASNNFLAGVFVEKDRAGVAFLDISTGEFLVAEGGLNYVSKVLEGFAPSEVLFLKSQRKLFTSTFGDQYVTFPLDDWVFTKDFARDILLRQFETSSFKGFGVEEQELGIIAAGACLHYVAETQHDKTGHITSLARIDEQQYVWLDRFTIRNLELFHAPHPDATSFLEVIDRTLTPMGSRTLRKWVALPLKDIKAIQERLDVVEACISHEHMSDVLREEIRKVGDLERLISKVAAARVSPRELRQLLRSLQALEPIRQVCMDAPHPDMQKMAASINDCSEVIGSIATTLVDDPPALLHKGKVIREGISPELDELRSISGSGKEHLLNIQQREMERTGIPSLKVAFNNVFGYYLEVTNAHKAKVPDSWIRKQTLVNAERYITEELKTYEEKILGAEEKIQALEARLFNELVLQLADHVKIIQQNAAVIARLDCLLSFAAIAKRRNYTKPLVDESQVIDIKGGRHPVIESLLPPGESYIANDVYLDSAEQQIMVITGPNMAGKSALLRQTALIVLMAQIGSYVPATQAGLGIIDKIFTRVGASDNISSGESTFMVEMNETASILNNLSPRSLVLLDEIGRGTSTYDGISIAWAITEYLHENKTAQPKTLFATHYHELNDMAAQFPRIRNFNVSVREVNNKVVFLRKLAPGGTAHSFGIHVARMAGMPRQVVQRADEMLKELEKSHRHDKVETSPTRKAKHTPPSADDIQLSFFQLDDPVLEQIRDEILDLDVNTLTPVEALLKLNEIKKVVGGK
ncbi:MAG: DNA mismatch repair protein MutS [Flavobacteriales bacterium]|nr:DNA mismatch repair protein MutS [Flavobacteriales bacterium]MCB9447007.1 DNA mismatch repair protein MutS [Flavobacteriales bacterium]